MRMPLFESIEERRLRPWSMADSPTLDEYMRHLQAALEEAQSIEDKIERDERTLQLETSIQECLIFANRYKELVAHGIDPLVLGSSDPDIEAPPPASKVQALVLGQNTCSTCGASLDSDLDFCPACGAMNKKV